MSPSRAYYFYTACHAAMFALMAATYVPFLQSLGLSLWQVTLVNVLFWATVVLFEVPTGMLADARSRAWSLRAGFALYVVGFIGYFFSKSIVQVSVFEIVDGIAFTFLSGIQDAWIVDALIKHGRGLEKGKVFAEATIVRGAVSLPCAILGAVVGARFGLDVPWIGSAFFASLALLIVWRFMNEDGEATEKVSEIEALKLSLKATHQSAALRWSVAMNIVFALVMAFNHLWAPYFRQWVSVEMLGYIWVPIYLSYTVAGALIRKAKIASGKEALAMTISLIVAGVGLAFSGKVEGLALTLIPCAVYEIGRAAFGPLLSSYTQHHVKSNHRATYGSLQSLLGEFGSILVLGGMTLYLSGRPDTGEAISSVWLGAGGLLVVFAVVLYALRPRDTAPLS